MTTQNLENKIRTAIKANEDLQQLAMVGDDTTLAGRIELSHSKPQRGRGITSFEAVASWWDGQST